MRLHELFEYHARTTPSRPCMSDPRANLDYGAAAAATDRLVNALRVADVAPGERFAYLSRNSSDMAIAFLAASKSGAAALPLNWRLAPAEWERILLHADVRVVIAQAEFAAAFDSMSDPGRFERFVIDGERPGWQDYRAWVGSQPTRAAASEGDDSLALYQMYTSGTTGVSKGAVLTHRSVISNSVQAMLVFEPRLCPSDCSLIVMPLFHAGAASFVIGTLITGASMVIHPEFTPATFIDALAGGVTIANVVPAMLQMALLHTPDIAERDYSRLHTVIYGASPIAEDLLRRSMEVFGCSFCQGYGQTETSATLTFLNAADHRRALSEKPELLLSAGRPVAGAELRIIDDQGRDVAPGEVGEILARGPQIMAGYWSMPEETAAAFKDGWLRTGDAGRFDDEGYLYVCDRVKDMIITGGENVYPREIENVLFSHPAVADVAVIGVPDDVYGEAVMAVIVCRLGAKVAAEEISAYCRGRLGGFKIPRQVSFMDALPRNASGKVLKRELRAPYWADRRRLVG